MRTKILFLLLFSIPVFLFSQNQTERRSIVQNTNTRVLKTMADSEAILFEKKKKRVSEMAKTNKWPLTFYRDNTYSELVDVSPDKKPIYYSTYNKGSGITSRANKLHTGGSLGLEVNGENMIAGIWDAASGLLTHELFEGRLKLKDNATSTHPHATHVAGTIIGSGLFQNGNAKGMAHKANAECYDWNNDIAEVATAASNGLLISNHSYGKNPFYVPTYEWGKYTSASQSFDEIMFNAPFYQFVCAAGNSRGYGVNTTKNGYDLLSGHATSKNGITVAAVNEVLDYTGAYSVIMSAFSSWGPTDDGRIKPDICTKGVDLLSSTNETNSSYSTYSGTSMASPSVAGTLLLYQQYYKKLNNSFMKAATLRGLMIHTADEAGTSVGPDYQFGWGLINAEKAADVIKKDKTEALILENTLNQNQTFSIGVNSINNQPLVATLCWTDPKGIILSNTTDDATASLINNLDIRITKESSTYLPWKLDPANVSNAATQGDNNVDNVEKVEISNPTGNYLITVSHKGNLLNSNQNYSLIVSGITVRDFWIASNQPSKSKCSSDSTIAYDLKLATKSNFNDVVTYSATDLPAGITASFSSPTMSSAGDFTLNLSNTNTLLPGKYSFKVKAQTTLDVFELEMNLIIKSPNVDITTLSEPSNNSNSIALPTVFNWVENSNAYSYDIQIASDSNFNTIIDQKTVTQNSYTSNALLNNSTYFWRVRAKNDCSIGAYSTVASFETICTLPTAITLSNTTQTTATLAWTSSSNSSSWEVQAVPQGQTPSATGVLLTTNQYNISGLTKNSCYDFYLKSFCGSQSSSGWVKKLSFCTEPDYCSGDHFYDTGGLSEGYKNNENYTKTIFPDNNNNRVKAIFNSFDIENYYDYLSIFNGPDASYPLLFRGTGNTNPGTIKSSHSSGALTFSFISDEIINRPGWDATILCEPKPDCPDENYIFSTNTKTTNSASITWSKINGTTSWEIEIVPKGNPRTKIGITTNSNTYIATGLLSNTAYEVYVRSKCSAGFTDWSNAYIFNTEADYCGGDHFYDTGGSNGNYPSYDYKVVTINPKKAGDRVKAIFNLFQIGTFDRFNIYDGTNTNGEILYSNSTNSAAPTTITATNLQGALTFYFYSYTNTTNAGWDASIICEPLPPCAKKPSNIYLNTKTTNTASFYWTENSAATSWDVVTVPKGTLPTLGTTVTSNQYTATGLTSNTWYDFYVRSKCGTTNSDWSLALTFNTEADYCAGDHFYDTGGPNDIYPSYDYKVITIRPKKAGDRVKAIFNLFQIGTNDTFKIYDGNSTSGQLLYSYSANSPAPTTITATNVQGALTFFFNSSSNITNAGWDASIVCEPFPPCALKPSNISLNSKTTNTATFSWTENLTATSWDVVAVPKGTLPTSGTTVTSKTYTLTGLTSNTWYDFYVRSKCSTTNSDWSLALTFNTEADYCAGDHFYDNGGPNGNYPSYDYRMVTINPKKAGDRVKAIFNLFQINNNYDTFIIYDGNNTSGQILYSNTTSSTAPATITATNLQGALTFYFNSYSNQTYAGWDATIVCEPFPPCTLKPSNITLNSKTTNTASVSWTENSIATSWDVALVPQNTLPTTGTTTNTKSYSFSGLTANTTYDFYVRSKCNVSNSEWSQKFSFKTEPDYCAGDHFYDTGGANGSYQNNESYTKTIYPTKIGDKVSATFSYINLESCCDRLYVYNGSTATASQLLFTSNGSQLPNNTLISTHSTGALTFVFNSDSSVTSQGWDATIVCATPPPCALKPTNINLNSKTTNTASFSWTENSAATSWDVAVVPQGTLPTSGTTVGNNPYTVTGLTSNTWYDFYVRSKCGNTNSDWSLAKAFITEPDYCSGDHFYDIGGPNGIYPSYDYRVVTINPKKAGDRVKAIFNLFQIGNSDTFQIYDGNSTSGQLLYSYSTNTPLPTTITAINLQGALTFYFSSSTNSTNAGWDASIICEPLPPCAKKPSNTYLNSKTTNSASFYWTENSAATSWDVVAVPKGTLPTSGTTVSSNPYTVTGLTSNTWYDFYVRSKCGNTNSDWSLALTFNTEADYCAGDHFYDTGGPNGNYPNYDYKVVTINPKKAGDRVKAIFNLLQIGSYDTFQIYDGNSTGTQLLYSYSTNTPLPTTIAATNTQGALTFYFYTSSSQTYAGWDATIVCEPLPPCSNKPSNIILNSKTKNSASFSWTENSAATSWNVSVVPQGTLPTSGTTITSNPYTATGLTANTGYDFYIRSKCGTTNSDWSLAISFTTDPDYCADNKFYDTGGANNNYLNSENYTKTIYPVKDGEKVSATFNYIELENCCDRLYVYNGPTATTSELLFTSNGTQIPAKLVSTHSTGTLTFVFYSDSSVTGRGWEATLNCGSTLGLTTENIDQNSIKYYPVPVTDVLNIKAKTTIKKINIFDVNMRLILQENINSDDFKINLAHVAAGVYFATLIDNENHSIEIKFLKK